MPYAQGLSESLLLGFETSFKVMPGTPTADKIPVTNPSIRPSRNKFVAAALTGVPQPRPPVYGKVGVDGTFGLECNPAALTPAFKGLFGTPRIWSGAGTTVNAFEFGFGTMLPMFIEQRHLDITQFFLWNGIYIGQTQLGFKQEGLMEANFTIVGARQSLLQVEQVTGAITDRTGYDPISYLLARIKQGGVTLGYVKTVDLTINRKVGKETAMDQTSEIAVIFSEIPEVTGKLTAIFQDAALFNLAMAAGTGTAVETSLEIWCPVASGWGLLVELPTIKFQPGSPITNSTGLVTVDLAFDVYGKAGVSQIPGRSRSTYLLPSGLTAMNTLTLIVAPDGGGGQTFTFQTGDNTPDLVAARINATATGMVASVERQSGDTGGVIRIDSNTKGITSSINVSGGTGNATLKFATGLIAGMDNQSVWATVLSPLAT